MIPISVTVSRIGEYNVVDCCPMEELCTTARMTVLINSKGKLCGMQKVCFYFYLKLGFGWRFKCIYID